jgi:hypothetical protein
MFLFLIMAKGAMAQMIGLPDAGVTLAGTPTAPVIVNDSSHRILRYTLVEQDATGNVRPHSYDMIRQFINDPLAGIAPGAEFPEAQLLQRTETRNASGAPPPPAIQVALDSVLFDDGVLVGPDKSNSYDAITARLQAQHDINAAVEAGNWSNLQQIVATGDGGVRALASSGMYERNYRLFVVSAAKEVLSVRDRSGDAAALKRAASMASFPMITRGQR